MLDGLLLLCAFFATLIGMGWLALTLNTHWRQVCSGTPSANTVIAMRSLGSSALLISLLLCLSVDHASMASLVWVMLLAAAAMSIALTLSWRPQWLRVLAVLFARSS
jgi:hypothetical protein